jgi:hypothetical protein
MRSRVTSGRLVTNGYSERLHRFLRFAVERVLDGKTDQLKKAALGRVVYDRGSEFDPRTDSILWRAIDQDSDVIDILVQPRRDRCAAERFFRRLLRGQGRQPWRIITDRLRSYSAARRCALAGLLPDHGQTGSCIGGFVTP